MALGTGQAGSGAEPGCRDPAHTLSCRAALAPQLLPPPPAATGIPGQAQQGLCKGHGPAKLMYKAFASPRHDAPGDKPQTMTAPRTRCGWMLPAAHSVQGPGSSVAALLCSQPGLQHAQAAKRADGLAGGQRSSARDSHSILPVPRHSAHLTPSPRGTAPVPVDSALPQRRQVALDLPHPGPCCAAAAPDHTASTGTPQSAPAAPGRPAPACRVPHSGAGLTQAVGWQVL